MAKDLDTVVQFYVDRLALQYRGLPKASATIAILLKQAVADFMAEDLAEAFNLDTAVGPQLDILAKYIGVPRRSNVPGTIEYFGYALVAGGGSINGYNSILSALNGFIYDRVLEGNLPLTDFTDLQFLFALRLQIALNRFDGTLAYIQQFLAEFFPNQIWVVDNLDMSLTYNVVPDLLPISTTILVNFLPRPMGCGITINVLPVFHTRVTSDGYTRVTSTGYTRITQG